MQTQGKFALLQLDEFEGWLRQQNITRRVYAVQQHHTWLPNYSNFKDTNHFDLLRGMKNSHLERGFSDIAQHFTTFPDGTIGTGRPLNEIPAGIAGANTGGVCIEHLGNFDHGGDLMTSFQRETAIKITATLLTFFGIVADTNGILYHHWYDLTTHRRTNGSGNTKTCPGTNFFGGNSVESCQANFIPLVRTEMSASDSGSHIDPARILKVGKVDIQSSGSLNVRSGPSSQFRVVDQLRDGIQVNCYEMNSNWWRVHPSEQRWAFGTYINEIQI